MQEFDTALDLAAAVRTRQVSPTEVMDETLARIDARNAAVNAVVWIDPDDARARAAAATERVASTDAADLPPFIGVPLPIKDLYEVTGWPVTYGSIAASGEPAGHTALPVQRLADAGFVLSGLTNSPEFGTITATENQRYGITRNPWNLDHTSGGSSGGASAAVASGMFSIAHASDGGGSIRIPASCTGLVGLKASRGRVPARQVSWEGAATQGVVTRTVADTAAVLDVLSVPDSLGWWHALPTDRPFLTEIGVVPARLRVAVVIDPPIGEPADPECRRAVEVAVEALGDAGHEIVDVSPDFHLDEFMTHFIDVVDAGMADYDLDFARVEPHNRVAHRRARAVDSIAYAQGVHALQTWTARLASQWGGAFDVLITPTMPIQPVRAGTMSAAAWESPEEPPESLIQSVAFTAVGNMSGLPAISLPIHQATDSGLPIGVQVVGGPQQDALVLRLAAQLEAACPWHDRTPDLSNLA